MLFKYIQMLCCRTFLQIFSKQYDFWKQDITSIVNATLQLRMLIIELINYALHAHSIPQYKRTSNFLINNSYRQWQWATQCEHLEWQIIPYIICTSIYLIKSLLIDFKGYPFFQCHLLVIGTVLFIILSPTATQYKQDFFSALKIEKDQPRLHFLIAIILRPNQQHYHCSLQTQHQWWRHSPLLLTRSNTFWIFIDFFFNLLLCMVAICSYYYGR